MQAVGKLSHRLAHWRSVFSKGLGQVNSERTDNEQAVLCRIEAISVLDKNVLPLCATRQFIIACLADEMEAEPLIGSKTLKGGLRHTLGNLPHLARLKVLCLDCLHA